jgi:hypothetical protein
MAAYQFNLSELKHCSKTLINTWLSHHNVDSFRFLIDWEIYTYPKDPLEIYLNYKLAAYSGELLSQCAQLVKYNAPYPQEEPFMFVLSNCNKKKLAKKLDYIVDGYFSPGEGMTRFSIRSHQYFIDVLNGKIQTQVPALINLAEKFSKL